MMSLAHLHPTTSREIIQLTVQVITTRVEDAERVHLTAKFSPPVLISQLIVYLGPIEDATTHCRAFLQS
jgi:hypothetical protein